MYYADDVSNVLRKVEYVEHRREDKGTAQKPRSLARELGRAITRFSTDDIVLGERQVGHKTRERKPLSDELKIPLDEF